MLYAAVVEAIFPESVVAALKAVAKLDPTASVGSNALAGSASGGWVMVVASDYPFSPSPSSDRHLVSPESAVTAAEWPGSHWRCGTNSQQTTPA